MENIWLSEDRSALNSLLQHIAVPIGIVEPHNDTFELIAHNQGLAEFYSATGEIHEPFYFEIGDFLPVDLVGWLERAKKNWSACFESGESLVTVTDYERIPGEQVWSENTIVPIKDGNKTKRLIVTIIEKSVPENESGYDVVCAW